MHAYICLSSIIDITKLVTLYLSLCMAYTILCVCMQDPPDVPNGLNGQSKSPIVRNSGVKVGEVGNSVLYDDSIGHRV